MFYNVNDNYQISSSFLILFQTYTCDSCGKVFAYQRSLREHERRHKGQKPFACDECAYRAVSLSQIHAHKKLHHQV